MARFTGHLVLVVGPSGAGKDSVLRGAARILEDDARYVFPRRIVTRHADANAEDHDTMSEMEFAEAVLQKEFALWWQAHDNCYGVSRSIERELQSGNIVVLNCSRAVLAAAAERYPHTIVVEISAPLDVLLMRIMARGRENEEEAWRRVTRKVPAFPSGLPVVTVSNVGRLDDAVEEFCAVLERLKHPVSHPGRSAFDHEDEEEDGDDDGGRLIVVE